MTCIVAIKTENGVYMGSDGILISHDTIISTDTEKVFKNGDFVFGVCGYAKASTVLKYVYEHPKRQPAESLEKYIYGVFYKSLVDLFESHNISEISNNIHNNGGSIHVGYRGRLFLCGL